MPTRAIERRYWRTTRIVAVLLASAAVLPTAGCGKGGRGKHTRLVEVAGRIRLHGKSLEAGTVTFIPEQSEETGGRPGIARIEADGSYRVGNANPDKPRGLLPGKYRVTVLSIEALRAPTGKLEFRDRVPESFSDWRRTPLTFNVDGPNEAADFDIE